MSTSDSSGKTLSGSKVSGLKQTLYCVCMFFKMDRSHEGLALILRAVILITLIWFKICYSSCHWKFETRMYAITYGKKIADANEIKRIFVEVCSCEVQCRAHQHYLLWVSQQFVWCNSLSQRSRNFLSRQSSEGMAGKSSALSVGLAYQETMSANEP